MPPLDPWVPVAVPLLSQCPWTSPVSPLAVGVEDTGKALGLSELQLSYLENGGDYHLFSRLRALNEVMQTLECLADTSKGPEPMPPIVTQPPVWTMALAWLLRGKRTRMHGQGLVTCFSLPASKGLWGQLLEGGPHNS